jgi:hypothetical protein
MKRQALHSKVAGRRVYTMLSIEEVCTIDQFFASSVASGGNTASERVVELQVSES